MGDTDSETQDLGVCQSDPIYMRVTLSPHPLSDVVMTIAEASNVTVGPHVGLTMMLKIRDDIAAPEEPEPAPQPTPDPAPTPDNGGDDTTSDPASSPLNGPVEIARGHLDVRLVQVSGGNDLIYDLAAKDDSLTNARTSVLRTVGSTTLGVAPNACFIHLASPSDPGYGVLGPAGTVTYMLLETQKSDIVWSGLSTEDIDYTALPKGVDLILHLAQAPEDIRVTLFQGSIFDAGARVRFGSPKGDSPTHMTEAAHMYGNWIFSAPDAYRIKTGVRNGERGLVKSQPFTVVARSGHHDKQPIPVEEGPVPTSLPGPSPALESVPTPAPEPTPTLASSVDPAPAPSVDPTPAPSPDPTPAPVPTVDPTPAPAPSVDPVPVPASTADPVPVPVPTTNPAPAPVPATDPAPAPAPIVDPAPMPRPFPSPAPTGSPARVPVAPVTNTGTPASSDATRSAAPTATGGSMTDTPATRSSRAISGTTDTASSALITVPKAALVPIPPVSLSVAPQSGAQNDEVAQSGGMPVPENGTADALSAMPIAAAAEAGRSGGWSPYWLVLFVTPVALAGGGAGYLIRTR